MKKILESEIKVYELNENELEKVIGGSSDGNESSKPNRLTDGEKFQIATESAGTLAGIGLGIIAANSWIKSSSKRKNLSAWGKFWRGAVAVLGITSLTSGVVNGTIGIPGRLIIDN